MTRTKPEQVSKKLYHLLLFLLAAFAKVVPALPGRRTTCLLQTNVKKCTTMYNIVQQFINKNKLLQNGTAGQQADTYML